MTNVRPNGTIRHVLMDVDGVLVPGGTPRFAEHLQRMHGITRDMTQDFFAGPFVDCLKGLADLTSVLPRFLRQWGWTAGTAQFLKEWFESEHVLDGDVLRVLERIQESGMAEVHLATNQEAHRLRYLLDEMGLSRYTVDPVFASCRLGHVKPSTIYYTAVLDALESPPGSVLFWDDGPTNVSRAREMGIHAELFDNAAHFVRTMQGWFPGV